MRQFTLEISYSQIAVFNASIDRPFNNWTEDHFNQGFVWRPISVSFRTAARTGQGQVWIDRPVTPRLREDAVVAISVPFTVTDPRLEIASVFKGEVIDMEPGEYELVFQTGKTDGRPWVDLQFIPHKIDKAAILRGRDQLSPRDPLLMIGEPA